MDVDTPVNQRKKGKTKTIVLAVLAVLIIGGLGTLAVMQYLEIDRLRDPSNTTQQADASAAQLKEKVALLMELPDEDATVATVTDAEKLKGQDFFKNAEKGDKVLIFTAAKKAVIYRESTNKVINAGPIILSSSTVEE